MMINVNEAAEFLRENDDYLILMHASPDGDTLGCGYALCGALQRMGKRAVAVFMRSRRKRYAAHPAAAFHRRNRHTYRSIQTDLSAIKKDTPRHVGGYLFYQSVTVEILSDDRRHGQSLQHIQGCRHRRGNDNNHTQQLFHR